jgi:Reverse transcriptase (RNA-dependent DNA polymerase)
LINVSTGVFIFFYVDDFLLIAPKHQQAEIDNLKHLLNEKYEIKDYGPATSFLNIVISRDLDNHRLTISQEPYIDKLIQKFHLQAMIQGKISTPLTPGIKLVPHTGQATENQIKEYQTKTGSVLYAAIVTRPDVTYAASLLCQFNSNPSLDHRREVDRVLGYLACTKALGLEFSTQLCTQSECPSRVYEVASDASFADDVATRRSTQGFVMKLFNGPIVWQSARQKTVTTSTTEAELLALSHTARETVAICRLFSQMGFKSDERTTIDCDNMQTVGLIQRERPELTTKLRHVDIHHLWLRQTHRQGLVEVK